MLRLSYTVSIIILFHSTPLHHPIPFPIFPHSLSRTLLPSSSFSLIISLLFNSFQMSMFFCDPFFDDYYSFLTLTPYTKKESDLINPASGFGRLDVEETDKEYKVLLDLPGMKKEEVKTSIENHCLVVEGERKSEKKDKKYHVSERSFGSFHREVSLPENADLENVTAVYENGELKVTIPKKQLNNGKKAITVN